MNNQKQNNDLLQKIECTAASLVKKSGILFIWILVCAIGVDVFKTLTYAPEYMSTMQAALVLEENTYSQLEQAQSYITTLDYIFNGQVVKDYIKEKMNVDDVEYTCNVSSQNQTNIVNISVTAPTKREAYYSLEYLTEWYVNNAAQYHLSYELDVLQRSQLNESPVVANGHFRNLRLGVIISFVFILIYAFIIYLRPTVKTANDIEKQADCRLFARIPKEHKKHGRYRKDAILITSLKTSFAYKEAVKKLRSRIESSAEKHGYRTFMITSSVENEGKSSIAANLALSLSQNQHKVLIIDGDIRKPSLHKIFQIRTDRSINQYLEGKQSWESQIDYLEKQNLSVLCAKQDLENSEKLIQDRLKGLIEEAKKEFDLVIIDTSPAYGINEPLIINEWVDASLLVVKQNEAPLTLINETITRIVQAKNNLIGCIYNSSVADLNRNRKIYGYRYGYNRYSRR